MTDEDTKQGADGTTRYGDSVSVTVENGQCIVYDRQNADAWIQTDENAFVEVRD